MIDMTDMIELNVLKNMIELNVLEFTQGSCVSTWDIRNTTTLCNTCENVSLKSLRKKKASVEMVVTDCDEVSYKVNVGHVLIGNYSLFSFQTTLWKY